MGASVDNSIHDKKTTDILTQIANYSSNWDEKRNKEIIAMFATTNDVIVTWDECKEEYKTNCGSSSTTPCKTPKKALDVVGLVAGKLVNGLHSLIPQDVAAVAPDFLIFPIPPLELAPRNVQSVKDIGVTSDAIKELTEKYNRVLMDGAKSLHETLGNRGNVYVYDIPG